MYFVASLDWQAQWAFARSCLRTPASGKSTVAAFLAENLQLPLFDKDTFRDARVSRRVLSPFAESTPWLRLPLECVDHHHATAPQP